MASLATMAPAQNPSREGVFPMAQTCSSRDTPSPQKAHTRRTHCGSLNAIREPRVMTGAALEAARRTDRFQR
jgi:hypothetical protein